MQAHPSEVLILGTSHVGKSTCARGLSDAVGWPVISTDGLGRHPGRPWTGVPAPVTEFYLRLSDEAVYWFLRAHHNNMKPVIRDAIREARLKGGFILEGAALRPEYLDHWDIGNALLVCLHADDGVLRERILTGSFYAEQSGEMKRATEAFIERSLRENRILVEAAKQYGINLIDVTSSDGPGAIVEQLVELQTERSHV